MGILVRIARAILIKIPVLKRVNFLGYLNALLNRVAYVTEFFSVQAN